MTPTARTLKRLREMGFAADVCERWIPFNKVRKDLFGFADVIYLNTVDRCIVAVQVTSGPNASARVKKIRDEPRARAWVEAGGRIQVHAWRKHKKGGRVSYHLDVIEVVP